jgi:hypothetical protein
LSALRIPLGALRLKKTNRRERQESKEKERKEEQKPTTFGLSFGFSELNTELTRPVPEPI